MPDLTRVIIYDNLHSGAADDFVFDDGTTLRVEWYYTTDGRMPAREHFLSLLELDQERL